MSTLASRIKTWYVNDKWTKTMVENVHGNGKITDEELAEILAAKGEPDTEQLRPRMCGAFFI